MRTSPKELFEAGVHIGHQRKRWNPKTRPYIYDHRGGISIINLEKTCEQIDKTWDFMRNLTASGQDIWFVGTKKQARDIVKEGAGAVEMPFCANRWLGGTLTNFQTIERSLLKYKKFLKMEEEGELAKLPKKEGASIKRVMNKMHNNFEGMMKIESLPGALFVIDIRHEYIAVAEANRVGIPVIAMVDTNSDPTLVEYPIIANDDSVKSIRLILGILLEGVQDGLSQRTAKRDDAKKLISKEELVSIEPDVTIDMSIDTETMEEPESEEKSAIKPKRKRSSTKKTVNKEKESKEAKDE
ncbi:MAG: 30S ribosomal protein S2 [Puniceicoccales bacterium]|jgi:small subunit ribosomal protein S2|nr:30S ribosomal protein S2 [Puniceicoccales bacterium]